MIQDPTLKLKEIDWDKRFEWLDVPHDTDLHTFISEKKKHVYKRGTAFFEFTSAVEDINDDREVILRDKVQIYYTVFTTLQNIIFIACQ